MPPAEGWGKEKGKEEQLKSAAQEGTEQHFVPLCKRGFRRHHLLIWPLVATGTWDKSYVTL